MRSALGDLPEDVLYGDIEFDPAAAEKTSQDMQAWLEDFIKSHGGVAVAQDLFDPAKHPRGQPENAGEFAPKGQGTTTPAPKAPAAPEEPKQAAAPAPAPKHQAYKPKPKATKAGGVETFISPNTGNLSFTGAEQELAGKRHQAFAEVSTAIDTRLGLRQSKSADVIGAWADGAENSLMVNYAKNADPDRVRAAAAMKASLAEQKAVLIFKPDAAGEQHMASFQAKGSLAEIHDNLLKNGLAFHTLEPTEDGAVVHILVGDQETADAVVRTAGSPEAVQIVKGNGEFLGTNLDTGSDADQRADAQRVYGEVIDQVAGGRGGQDLREVWRDANNHWRAATGVDNGVGLVGSQGHPALISTRRPTAVGALESDRYRRVDLASMRQEPENYAQNMGLLKNAAAYPNFRPGELARKSPDQIARIAIDHAKANLKFLYEHVDPEVREQGPKWYEGANRMAAEAAKKFNLPLQSAVGVFAALSPQKDWDQNVYLAERTIEIYQTKQNEAWDDKMSAKGEQLWGPRNPAAPTPNERKKMAAVERIRGKKLSELTDPTDKAIWLRTYDEANSDRHYQHLSPDGTALGEQKNLDGSPAVAAWQGLSAIANAIEAMQSNGDRSTISRAMGDRHKVRSFYNNILDPHSPNGDVTMDTHAVGAALLRPLSGTSSAVMHNLALTPPAAAHPPGWKATTGSAVTGLSGTYGLWADAYRETAAELGVEPRVLQSVVWEAKRRMMPDNQRDVDRKAMEAAWQNYHAGNADLMQTQNRILEIAGGKSS